MTKKLKNTYDKKLIADLPRVTFGGAIHVIQSESQAEQAIRYLLSQPILGIDTETRPRFKKGVNHRVALLQVATHNVCFLFRLNLTGITPSLKALLEDNTIPKIGLSVHDDILALRRRTDFKPGRFIELQKEVKVLGIEDMSLQKLYANIFGQKISKTQQLSNWENDCLTEGQKLYAATDAWACIMLYEEIKRLHSTGDYTLEIIKQEIPESIPKEEEASNTQGM